MSPAQQKASHPDQLLPEHVALREAFIPRWIRIGLSTDPADRPRAERGLSGLYRRAGFSAPRTVWLPCLMSATLTAGCYGKIKVLQARGEPCSIASVVAEAMDDKVPLAYGAQVREAIEGAVCEAVASALEAGRWVQHQPFHTLALAIGQLSKNTFMWFENNPWNQALGPLRWPVQAAVRDAVGHRLYLLALRASLLGWADVTGCCFLGAQHDADFYACEEFLQAVAGQAVDQDEVDVATSCGFVWLFDGVCIAAERPSAICRDGQGRLHGASGQSVAYAGTGWGLWTWHGLKIPADRFWVLETPDRITLDAIRGEERPDMRRVMCERVGWDEAINRFNGVTVARHEFAGRLRQLVDLPMTDGDTMRLLRISFPSADDPLEREFVELVPNGVSTLHEAEAWLFGVHPTRFREAVRV